MRLHEEPGKKAQRIVTWKDIEKWVDDIVDHIIVSGIPIKQVVAIGGGGLIPAAWITYCLTKKQEHNFLLAVQYASSYNDLNERKQVILGPEPATIMRNSNILIVDDIADSGYTLNKVLDRFHGAHTAVLVHKDASSFHPDFCGYLDKDGDKYWYVFPWEK